MDEDVASLGEGGAQIVRDRRLVYRANSRAELVRQLVDRGDADIETQTLDLVLDLGQRRMSDPADALRLIAILRRRAADAPARRCARSRKSGATGAASA